MLMTEICAEIKNYFTFENDRHIGNFSIENGMITPQLDIPTDYIRIVGSHLNDGVHHRTNEEGWGLVDEPEFHGAVWIMSPPVHFIGLVEEIESWQEANGKADSVAMSPFQSESFGGYSYSKGSGSSGSGGASSIPTWLSQYASRLKIYRRIREI